MIDNEVAYHPTLPLVLVDAEAPILKSSLIKEEVTE
jgi:hypothetical protein